MNNLQLVEKDTAILKEMVANMPDYLDSRATHWTLPQPNMPKLTIGGCLMRLHRLQAIYNDLPLGLQQQIKRGVQQFDDALKERIVRFEVRATEELHDRLSEWCSYLRYIKTQAAGNGAYYQRIVDTRVVIAALVDKLSQKPFRLDPSATDEMAQFDKLLRTIWQPGEFIWEPVWQPAYPQEPYWFLYGLPKTAVEKS